MGLLENIGGIIDVGTNLFKTGYNIYTNQRDYDYQRNLQQQIFNREDNAVQRRVEDLKAAGMNPALAAGSAAQAGSVVARSNTNDLNIGSVLDTVNAMNQIKLQKDQIKGQKIQNEILAMDYDKKLYDNALNKWRYTRDQAQILTDMGIPYMTLMYKDDDGVYKPGLLANEEFDLYHSNIDKSKSYELQEQLKKLEELGLNIDSMQLNNALSQIDLDFASAGKVAKFLEILIKAIK